MILHLFRKSNECNTIILGNSNPGLLTKNRNDLYHHHNYCSCKEIIVAGTTALIAVLCQGRKWIDSKRLPEELY